MREGAEKEQALVEADYLAGVDEFEVGKLSQEFGYKGRVGGIDPIPGGFELSEELGGISRDRRHARRHSLPQSARGEKNQIFTPRVRVAPA